MHEKVVVLDLETGGFDPQKHAITQIGMIAVDAETLTELERFEVKILFPPEAATAEALEISSYDPDVWDEEAVMPDVAASATWAFLKEHATMQKIGKGPPHRPYKVAELMGYVVRFDVDFMMAWAKRRKDSWFPAWPVGLDVMQLALWRVRAGFRVNKLGPESYKLVDVAKWLGVESEGEAHDAMADCELTLGCARRLTE